jgi:hypothetical protein
MNDYELWHLAQQRQAELLKEAENERLLREAGLVKPKPLAARLLVAVCVLFASALAYSLAAGSGPFAS